ncbi:TOMM precursor leader peptide-binding protein [Nonomuraea typhae]|uniref:TOMM leader peptide-binding protein n=1 Tax=Nonomuraea typhae TaxID=2603600 RepID=A0ABW7YUQ9_9ACTN
MPSFSSSTTPSTGTEPRHHAVLLAAGPFGLAVAERLSGSKDLSELYTTTVLDIDTGTHPSLWPHADLFVLAVSHERPRIADAVDRAAFAWGTPWLESCLETTDIRVGPVVVPGCTACYRCFVNRRRQHRRLDPPPARERHPTGFAVHHAGIAAGLTRQAMAEAFGAPDPARLGGGVRRFSLVTGATSRSDVVAGDRCPRCRIPVDSTELWRRMSGWRESR